MKERAVLFGPSRGLLALITEPPRDVARAAGPGIILINAGLIHRIGPNRLYVKIARRLAAAGLPVLRFDLSGIGDSQSRRDGVSIDERAVLEAREAMDYLADSRKLDRFVLAGLCSGADDAFRAALADDRVTGLILIDPCLYPSLGHTVRAYARRMWRWRSWLDLVTGRSDLWTSLAAVVKPRIGHARPDAAWDWTRIPGDTFREGLLSLTRRGTELLLVYSPDNAAFYNYDVHVRRTLGPGKEPSALRVISIPGADHTFTRIRHQQALLDVVANWAREVLG